MGDLFDIFDGGRPENTETGLEKLLEYQKYYAKALREYKDEISYIDELQRRLREEQKNFYNEELWKINEVMKADDVSEELRQEWLKHLEVNMEISFRASANLIKEFTIENIDRFKKQAENILRGI